MEESPARGAGDGGLGMTTVFLCQGPSGLRGARAPQMADSVRMLVLRNEGGEMRMNGGTNVDWKTSWFGSAIARRWFLARLGAGAGALGAAAVGGSAMAETPAEAAGAGWKPAFHSQDDWLEKIPGQHRFVFDTVTPAGLDLAFTFGGNYFAANHDAYGLEDHELAVVMIARHKSTAFGYNDAMWAKYGKQFSEQSGFADAKTSAAPTANLYAERMDALVKKGVQF